MPSWLIKIAIHRAIALLPHRQRWNELFQRTVTKSLQMGTPTFELRLEQCGRHLEALFALQPGRSLEFTVLELGTGWFPTLAIAMHLCGASEIWTYDIDPLLRKSALKLTVDFFCDYHARGELARHLPRLQPERVARLGELRTNAGTDQPGAFLERLGIHYRVCDAQNSGLPPASIDLSFSHGVLLHPPLPMLRGLLAELRRVAAPSGATSHYVDLSDVHHYFDRSITPFNFLKFTAAKWRHLDSPLVPLNRLRISDYRSLFKECGWEIIDEKSTTGPESDLAGLRLAPEFQDYDRRDLLVIRTWLAARVGG